MAAAHDGGGGLHGGAQGGVEVRGEVPAFKTLGAILSFYPVLIVSPGGVEVRGEASALNASGVIL